VPGLELKDPASEQKRGAMRETLRTKIRDDRMYNPSVAKRDSTIFRKMLFEKKLPKLRVSDEAMFCMPFTARKNAANYMVHEGLAFDWNGNT
jgi:hypothetical protein